MSIKFKECGSVEELFAAIDEVLGEEVGLTRVDLDEAAYGGRDLLTFDEVRVGPNVTGELQDLSDEAHRTYVYDDGELTLSGPVALRISESGSHYIVTENGFVTYVPAGWRYLTWLPREGENHISF